MPSRGDLNRCLFVLNDDSENVNIQPNKEYVLECAQYLASAHATCLHQSVFFFSVMQGIRPMHKLPKHYSEKYP